MRHRGAAEKSKEEAGKTDGNGLLPLQLEDNRVEFRAGEKGEHDRADAGRTSPRIHSCQGSRSDGRPDDTCAIVPTTISDKAVEMRSQIDKRLAINARPNHSAAKAQTPVMFAPSSPPVQ